MAAQKKASARADVGCAACGRCLELWDATKALDGRTVCASGCIGAGIVDAREREEYQEEPPELPPAAYFDPADCGGTFDGFNLISDADPGL